MPDTPPPLDLAAIAAEHAPLPSLVPLAPPQCERCQVDQPCVVNALVARVRALEGEVEALEENLYRHLPG